MRIGVSQKRRRDGKPVSQKAAEQIKKVAKAQADVEARGTPESQEGESMSPFAEVAAIRAQLGTQDRAGRVPGLAFGARPTQLYPPSRSSGSKAYSVSSSGASQSYEAR